MTCVDNGQIDLHEDTLVFALCAEGVLSPATDVATMTGKHLKGLRQADGRNVRMLAKVNLRVQLQYGHVIGEVARGKVRMDDDLINVFLNVRVELVLTMNVPLTKADL